MKVALPSVITLVLGLVACGGGEDPCPTGEVRIGAACVLVAPDAGDADVGIDAGARPDCSGMADGESCGEELLCIGEVCLNTQCGDGFVDVAAGEDCDDGNEISGDGCEPATCAFSCTPEGGAESCSDGDPCNGPESCGVDSHRCETGTPAEETACEREDTTVGICSGGLCAPLGCGNGTREGAETCDDGNDDQDDGCKSDCTYSCVEDIDCSDADLCTGVEACDVASHTCDDPEDLTCDDEEICTADSCDPATGCVFALIDDDEDGFAEAACTGDFPGGDCDDVNGSVYPGAPEQCDSLDNDCDGMMDEDIVEVECHVDDDNDGYGEPASTTACMCPVGTVLPRVDGHFDCDDGNSSVHAGQLSYFDTPRCSGAGCDLDTDYDYDCDGVETMRITSTADGICTLDHVGGVPFCRGAGWTAAVPACGRSGSYRRCGTFGSDTCPASIIVRGQTCR